MPRAGDARSDPAPPTTAPIANSQVRNGDTFGVLRLALKTRVYSWTFMPADPGGFTDSGSSMCHS